MELYGRSPARNGSNQPEWSPDAGETGLEGELFLFIYLFIFPLFLPSCFEFEFHLFPIFLGGDFFRLGFGNVGV